ncbi:MAG: aldehyde dehydrogenase family protein, partial [bacterium]|nr:aldehyde dehydrogenase family protein [bacterium]
VNIVSGFGDAGAALVGHPMVDKIAFTGSTEVGKLILQGAAGNLKKVSLELGGKSPNIVFADANLDAAIPGAANSIFFNQGQCCCAGSRLFVEHSIFDKVVEGVAQIAKNIRLGDGFDKSTQMGPLVSKEQFDRVCGYIESGKNEGAEVIVGGKALSRSGYFVEPTVLTKTNANMKVISEEIFGPVLAIIPFKSIEEVVQEANNSEYGLAAGIWTENITKAHAVSAQLKAGTTWINCYNIFDAGLPFGGYKQSGWGREMGKQALDMYTETKSVCLPIT